MTREEALAKVAEGWWKGLSAQEVVAFQLYEDCLCMPFAEFHKAITEVLGRPVYTHEFGLNRDGLMAEFEGKRGPASLAEVLNQLPPEKIIVVEL